MFNAVCGLCEKCRTLFTLLGGFVGVTAAFVAMLFRCLVLSCHYIMWPVQRCNGVD